LSEFWNKSRLEDACIVLGLDQDHLSIYLAAVSLGRGTLGQISQLSGVNVLESAEILKELAGQGLIAILPGVVSRFIPVLPFLKAFSAVYDTSIIVSIADQLVRTGEQRDAVLSRKIEALRELYHEKLGSEDQEFDTSLSELQEIVSEEIVTFRKEFQAAIQAVVFHMRQVRENLGKLLNASSEILKDLPEGLVETEVLIGETSVLLMIHDMVSRARNSLQIILAQPEFKTLKLIDDLSGKTRVRLIGNFEGLPAVGIKLLSKLSDKGVTIRTLSGADVWIVQRDNEELLIAPAVDTTQQRVMTGLITTNSSIMAVFSETLASFSAKSQQMKF